MYQTQSGAPSEAFSRCPSCLAELALSSPTPGYCQCVQFNNFGQPIGTIFKNHIATQIAWSAVAECRFIDFLTEIERAYKAWGINELRIIMHFSIGDSPSLFSRFFIQPHFDLNAALSETTLHPNSLQLIAIAPELLLDFLDYAIRGPGKKFLQRLIAPLRASPAIQAQLPFLFEYLYISPTDYMQQCNLMKELCVYGFSPFIEQVATFFPLVEIIRNQHGLYFSEKSAPEVTADVSTITAAEQVLIDLSTQGQWKELSEKLCWLSSRPCVIDIHLFGTLFLNLQKPNVLYETVFARKELQEQALFPQIIRSLFFNFLYEIKENGELNRPIVERLMLLKQIGCLKNSSTIELSIQRFMYREYPMAPTTVFDSVIRQLNIISGLLIKADLQNPVLEKFFKIFFQSYHNNRHLFEQKSPSSPALQICSRCGNLPQQSEDQAIYCRCQPITLSQLSAPSIPGIMPLSPTPPNLLICDHCEKKFRGSSFNPDEHCDCPIFDGLGNFLGYHSAQQVQAAGIMNLLKDFDSFIKNLEKKAASDLQKFSNLNQLKLLLYVSFPSPQNKQPITLISKFTTEPELIKQLSPQLQLVLIPGLLVEAILGNNLLFTRALFELINDIPDLIAAVPPVFKALFIDPENLIVQQQFIQKLSQCGCPPLLQTQALSFCPKISSGNSQTFSLETELKQCVQSGNWELLDQKLCFVSLNPRAFDATLFEKLFFLPQGLSWTCQFLQNPTLQQQPLFSKTIQNVLFYFLTTILERDTIISSPHIDEIRQLHIFKCLSKKVVQEACKMSLISFSKGNSLYAEQVLDKINNLKLLFKFCDFEPFPLKELQDFAKQKFPSTPKLVPSTAITASAASSSGPSQKQKVSSNSTQARLLAKLTTQRLNKSQEEVALEVAEAQKKESLKKKADLQKQIKEAEKTRAQAIEKEARAQRALQKKEEEGRVAIQAARDKLAVSFLEKNHFKIKHRIFHFLKSKAAAQIDARDIQIEQFQRKHADHLLQSHFSQLKLKTQQVKAQEKNADEFREKYLLQSHFSQLKLKTQQADQVRILRQNIENAFSLTKSLAAIEFILQTLIFLHPIMSLVEQGKIELFIYGSTLTYCVYQLDGLPNDIDIQIHAYNPDTIQKLGAILETLGFSNIKGSAFYLTYQSSHLVIDKSIDITIIKQAGYRSLEPIVLSRLKLQILSLLEARLRLSNRDSSGYDDARISEVLAAADRGGFEIEYPNLEFQPTSFFSRVIKKFELWKRIFGSPAVEQLIGDLSDSIFSQAFINQLPRNYAEAKFCEFLPVNIQHAHLSFLSYKTKQDTFSRKIISLAEQEILDLLKNHSANLKNSSIQTILSVFIQIQIDPRCALQLSQAFLMQATQLLTSLFLPTGRNWEVNSMNLRHAMDLVQQHIHFYTQTHPADYHAVAAQPPHQTSGFSPLEIIASPLPNPPPYPALLSVKLG